VGWGESPRTVGKIMNELHESNRTCWNSWSESWSKRTEKRNLWKKCLHDPSLVFSLNEMRHLNEIQNKEVCVLGSGDNEAVFALTGMGAFVTSVDISECQLATARERADKLGLKICFIRADVTDLACLDDGMFDLVYTGGHMSVWISDIERYYREAVRILKSGGYFLINEYHPVRRMWHESDGPKPGNRYFHRGPYTYRTEGGMSQYEFHWTVADHIQAVIDAGCSIEAVDEHGENDPAEEYEKWVPASLPLYLLICGRASGRYR